MAIAYPLLLLAVMTAPILMKLVGLVDWSWGWVTAPIWGLYLFAAVTLGVFAMAIAVAYFFGWRVRASSSGDYYDGYGYFHPEPARAIDRRSHADDCWDRDGGVAHTEFPEPQVVQSGDWAWRADRRALLFGKA